MRQLLRCLRAAHRTIVPCRHVLILKPAAYSWGREQLPMHFPRRRSALDLALVSRSLFRAEGINNIMEYC